MIIEGGEKFTRVGGAADGGMAEEPRLHLLVAEQLHK